MWQLHLLNPPPLGLKAHHGRKKKDHLKVLLYKMERQARVFHISLMIPESMK
jgi:hypothetical protein